MGDSSHQSLTDNGSNLVATFRVQLQHLHNDEKDEDEEEKMEAQEPGLGDESIHFEDQE